MVRVVTLKLQTIGNHMFQDQSCPCCSLERSQQGHGESASLGDSKGGIPEKTKKDIYI